MNPFESTDAQESRSQACFEPNHPLAGTDVRGVVPSTSTASSADHALMPVEFSDGHGSSVSGRSETDWDRALVSKEQAMIRDINTGLLTQDFYSLAAAIEGGAQPRQLRKMLASDRQQIQQADSHVEQMFAWGKGGEALTPAQQSQTSPSTSPIPRGYTGSSSPSPIPRVYHRGLSISPPIPAGYHSGLLSPSATPRDNTGGLSPSATLPDHDDGLLPSVISRDHDDGLPPSATSQSSDGGVSPPAISPHDHDRLPPSAISQSHERGHDGLLDSRHVDGGGQSLDATPLAATGNFKVSLINDMVQIPKTGALSDHQQQKVYAAKNDIQSIQIGIHSVDGSPLSNVNVSVSDLTGPNGAKIDSRNIDLFREHYVNVTKSSNAWQHANPANPAGPTGWYADGLIPFVDPATGKAGANPQAGLEGNHFNVAAGQNQAIWADIKVPKGTAAGDYRAVITVDSDKGKEQVPLNLHVWNFEAPTKPGLTTSFNAIGKNDAAVQKVLMDNKVSPAVSDPSLEQQYLAEGLTSRNVGFYSGADYGNPHMGAPPGVPAIESNKRAVNPSNDPNLELYDYSADEIGGHPELHPQIKQWAQNLHAAGVENLITMAPDPALLSDGTSSGKPAVDVFSMLPEQYDKTSADVMQKFKQEGAKMWSYNTLIQDDYSPKWEIDFSPLNERQQAGFISQSDGLTGLLDWSVTNWSGDPWNNPYKQFQAGEGVLVLPGQPAGLAGDAPTIRLKAIRDGIEDYDYVELLKKQGDGAFADQVVHSVGANFKDWSRDPDAVEKAHELMGDEIEKKVQHGE